MTMMASRLNTYERKDGRDRTTLRRINADGQVSINDCRREHSVPWGISCGGSMYVYPREDGMPIFELHRYGLSLRLRCVPLFL